MRPKAALGTLALILLVASAADAHPLSPTVLSFEAHSDHILMRWRSPKEKPTGRDVAPLLPDGCDLAGEVMREERADALVQSWRLHCDKPMEELEVRVRGVKQDPNAIVVVRMYKGGQKRHEGIIDAEEPTLRPGKDTAPSQSWRHFLRFGFLHLLEGLDHIAFVLGLLFLLGWSRALLFAITSFTIGHSLTLGAATFGVMRVSSLWVEIGIALSIVVVALEVLNNRSALRSRPWLVPLGFGCLHGLGFASAFADAGLPQAEIPWALLWFNIGVEAGQILVVCIAALLVGALVRLHTDARPKMTAFAGGVIGSMGAYWVIERLAQLF